MAIRTLTVGQLAMSEAYPYSGGPSNGREAPGLVLSSATHKTITVKPDEARLKRLRQSVITTSRIIQEGLTESQTRFQAAFLTLTYADDVPWDACHIALLLNHMRNHAKRKWGWSLPYVWVAEIQKDRKSRNPDQHCMHYHIIVWLPRGVKFPKPDKCGWWPHGSTNWLSKVRNVVGYMAKYASKEGMGSVRESSLKGARTWGYGGLSASQVVQRSWALAPAWVRKLFDEPMRVKRVVRTGVEQGRYGKTHEYSERWWSIGPWLFKSPWEFLGQCAEGVNLKWRGWGESDFGLDGVIA